MPTRWYVKVVWHFDIRSAPLSFEQVNIAFGNAAPEVQPFDAVARRITDHVPIKQVISKFGIGRRPHNSIVVRPAAAIYDTQHAADQARSMPHQVKTES